MVSNDYRDFVLEQLRRATPAVVHHRAMFGGVGIYADGVFFALIAEDVLYLRADEETRPAFESRGMGPFLPYDDPARPMRGYYQLPGDLLEDAESLGEWVEGAVAASRRARR